MIVLRSLLAACAACFISPAFAQADPGQCIVAGRLGDSGQWAPRLGAMQLLGQDGRVIARADKAALAGVKQARLAQSALLSRCDGDRPMANGDAEAPGTKTQVPAVSAGVVDVEAVSYPKLRTGGELVELKVRVPAQRVVMLTR